MKIAYEPHPVSKERKDELRAAGFKIIDARFKPAHLAEEPVSKNEGIPESVEDVDAMGKDDLRELLKAHGITPAGRAGVDKLREQLKEVMFMGAE